MLLKRVGGYGLLPAGVTVAAIVYAGRQGLLPVGEGIALIALVHLAAVGTYVFVKKGEGSLVAADDVDTPFEKFSEKRIAALSYAASTLVMTAGLLVVTYGG